MVEDITYLAKEAVLELEIEELIAEVQTEGTLKNHIKAIKNQRKINNSKEG